MAPPSGEPTAEQKSAQLDLGISLSLFLWPALTLAVQNNWGGPSSSDKRDWFGGAISEYVTSSTEVDEEDVEAMLVQVMLDEFEVAVDDGSAGEVADDIIRVRGECERGNFGGVEELKRRWEGGRGGRVVGQEVKGGEGSEEESESESEEEEEDEDVEMGEPQAPRERQAPQIDEDGFETVVSRKKR
ncbi:hypothetical protein VE01_09999 [Pseudogymnoascus verrucosus]|uniref:Pre-rRNA-processing protein TSR2 n=1 Tax=Pseudogymnoascus verrucosus TaxID=342668 RepID=A0A1B8G8R3_9PEZI|nr:uncharacterized protein VE01_09999 [Pseudogymnoascus verrucosus]OBT92229.1 hypothetical protein VE01_09999 [Pseudogymnoascus verrucosus]